MTAQFTDLLLRMDPRDALVAMINAENPSLLMGKDVEFDPPQTVEGGDPTLTSVVIRTRSPATDRALDATLPVGEITYLYHRVDLENRYQGLLSGFYPPMPTSVQVLIDELKRQTGHVLIKEDFVQRDISSATENPFILEAKVESWRFVGQLILDIVDLIPIARLGITDRTEGDYSDIQPVLRSLSSALPYMDATDFNILIPKMETTQEYQFNAELRTVLGGTLERADTDLISPVSTDLGELPDWPARLWDAAIVGITGDQPHPSNRDLQKCLVIDLGNQGDNPYLFEWLDDPMLYLPFYAFTEIATEFDSGSRISQFENLYSLDGTPHNVFFNQLQVTDVLTIDSEVTEFMISGDGLPWKISNLPGPYNLRDAVVLYNGTRPSFFNSVVSDQIRSIEGKLPLTRGIEFALDPYYNTHLGGNLRIPYEAPIQGIEGIPNAVRTATYEVVFDLATANPDRTAPFSMTVTHGALAPGHALSEIATGTHFAISGVSEEIGTYTFTLRVSDSAGVYTDYQLSYLVESLPLTLQGNAPPMDSTQPYDYTYLAMGGRGPYQFLILSGTCPYALDPTTGHLGGYPSATGFFSWVVAVQDQELHIATLSDSVFVS